MLLQRCAFRYALMHLMAAASLLLLVGIVGQTITANAAPTTKQMIDQLLAQGFEPERAMRIYGRWNEAKVYLNHIAKTGTDKQVQTAAKLVSGRLQAIDKVALDTAKQMAKKGYWRPVDAKFATGSLPPPKAAGALREYVITAAAKDIDATYVSRSTGAAEDYVERLAVNWATVTTGRPPIGPNKAIDYGRVNEILRNSDFTPFPHHPQGALSSNFRQKFPQIVHEAYSGPEGQRLLELKYGLKSKADVFRYGKNGVPSGFTRNQPAANIVEHANYARFTRFERMKVLKEQYEKKFMQHLTGRVSDNADTSAKMLSEMIENEARIAGYNPNRHPLYQKAKAIKDALRRRDQNALRNITGNKNVTQGLADFNVDADDAMAKMYQKNQLRMTEFADDNIGRPATPGSRLGTAAKALMLIGYGVVGTDAYLKAKEGEKAKEVAKALTAALAADAAGSAAAAAGAGFLSGVGAAAVAAVVVHGGIEYTEEGIDNLLGGYKTDATLKKIFLEPDTIKRFLKMRPEEIRKIIDREWDVQHQWGGAFVGKGTDDQAQQEKLKNEIFQKAVDTQKTLNAQALRAQIVGEVVREELEDLVARHDKGELSASDYKLLSGILKGEDTGELPLSKAWRQVFGTGFSDIVEQRLAKRYKSLQAVLNGMEDPDRPGLGSWVSEKLGFGSDPDAARRAALERYEELHSDQKEIIKVVGDYERHIGALRDAVQRGESDAVIAEIQRQLENDFKDLMAEYDTFTSGMATALVDINNSLALQDDVSKSHELKSEIARMLLAIEKAVRGIRSRHARLGRFNDLLEKAAHELEAERGRFDPSSPYDVLSVATETERVEHKGKAYERIKSVSGTAIVVRQKGQDYIIHAQAAVEALLRKGYLRRVARVGIVTQRSFDLLVDYLSQPEDSETANRSKATKTCSVKFETCKKKLGADLVRRIEQKMAANVPLSKLSSNEYWGRLCWTEYRKCVQPPKKPKSSGNWRKDYGKITPMTEQDKKMFSGGAGARSQSGR